MELKEVLHLYLGCPCEFFINMPGNLKAIGERMSIDVRVLHNVLSNIATCKPIIRPLSDMTEEEYEYVLNNFNLISRGQTVQQFIVGWRAFTPECTSYLLKQGFDLFGLIESGQAIDKTTIQQ